MIVEWSTVMNIPMLPNDIDFGQSVTVNPAQAYKDGNSGMLSPQQCVI